MPPTTAPPPPPLTDTDIITLAHNPPPKLPPFLLTPTSHPTLISYLQTLSQSPTPSLSVTSYLTALITLITLTTPQKSLSALLSSLLTSYLHLIISKKLPRDSNSSKTISLFSLHLNSIPKNHLTSITDLIVSSLSNITNAEDTQPLDLLPQCISLIQTSDAAQQARNYINSILDSILSCNWSKPLIIKIVSIMREFTFLDKARTKEFLDKVFSGMERVDLQDLPSLAYQLLVLASKGFSKRDVVEGVVGFFGERNVSSSIVRQVEGTVLLHVNFAVKQDPSLGQVVLGLVKSDFRKFNHFTVVVILSVSRVRRFSESAIGILKAAVIAAYKEHKFARDCKWLPDTLKKDILHNTRRVEQAVIRAVNESNYGREHVIPSIVQFGFALLISVEEENSEEFSNSDGLMGIEELGVQTLKTLFDVHDISRKEIIEQCKFHILSLKPQQCKPIIRFLSYLSRTYPYPLLEHVARLKDLLDYFSHMHGEISASLVSAVLPLINLSRDLQDYTILVVRKSLFSREDTVRLAATNAIINLILAEKQSNKDGISLFQESSSEASCSQQIDVPCGLRKGLFQELSGLLQRCLSQQANVKEVVYQGLMKFVLKDPFIVASVFDFLMPHFRRFYLEDENAHLNLSSCVKMESGKLCLSEPLDSLLSCVSWILLLQPHGKTDRPSDYSMACFGFSLTQDNEAGRVSCGESFSNALSNIRKLLRNGNWRDIVGQWEDSSIQSLEAEKCTYLASVLSGIVEVLINVIATELENATDVRKVSLEKELAEFIDLYDSLDKETITTKQSSSIKRGSPTATHDLTDKTDRDSKDCSRAGSLVLNHTKKPLLATSSIHLLLQIALDFYKSECSKSNAVSQKPSQLSLVNPSAQCLKLMSFALKVSLCQIKTFRFIAKDDPLVPLIFGDLKMLGCPLLKIVWLLKSKMDQKKKVTKGKKGVEEIGGLFFKSLICLKELIDLSLRTPRLSGLFDDLVSLSLDENQVRSTDPGNDNGQEAVREIEDQDMRNIHVLLDKRLKPLLSELLGMSLYRESEVLSDMILMLGSKLPRNMRDYNGAWVVQRCRESTLENPKAAKSLVALAVNLSPPPNDLIIAQSIASELLIVTDSEKSDPVEKSEIYPIINRSTESAVASSLLHLAESVVVDVAWCITKLKELSLNARGTFGADELRSEENSPVLMMEEALYMRSEALVNFLSFFAKMSLKDPQAEQFLRLTGRFYKQLALMTKLRIAPKGFRQILPGIKFEKLAETTCKRLTAPLYNFMDLRQKEQQENAQTKGIINKIKRENRCIPDLIFQIEDYEKYLIQLSKVTKVNLLRHAKRSTARDFRILKPNKIDSQEGKEEEEEEAEGEGEGEADPVSSMVPSPEENGLEQGLSPEPPSIAGDANDSESDGEGVNVNNSNIKRAKMSRSRVVQESDDDES